MLLLFLLSAPGVTTTVVAAGRVEGDRAKWKWKDGLEARSKGVEGYWRKDEEGEEVETCRRHRRSSGLAGKRWPQGRLRCAPCENVRGDDVDGGGDHDVTRTRRRSDDFLVDASWPMNFGAVSPAIFCGLARQSHSHAPFPYSIRHGGSLRRPCLVVGARVPSGAASSDRRGPPSPLASSWLLVQDLGWH